MNDVLQRRTGMSDVSPRPWTRKQPQSSTLMASRPSSTASRNAPNSSPECSPKPASRIFSKALYNEVAESPNQRRTLRINGKWTPIDTSTFDASMGVEVNSTLGKGPTPSTAARA